MSELVVKNEASSIHVKKFSDRSATFGKIIFAHGTEITGI
jgi:hypothetical protein